MKVSWSDPRGLCRACADQKEMALSLCERCLQRCATWQQLRQNFQNAPIEGEGWHVDNLPDSDQRVIAHAKDIDEWQNNRKRLWEYRFFELEIDEWLAAMLKNPRSHKWMSLERAL